MTLPACYRCHQQPCNCRDLHEADLLQAVHDRCTDRGSRMLAPHIHLLIGEQDLLEVTRAGYAVEYEIKLTAADFRADFKKRSGAKHKWLSGEVSPSPRTLPRRFWFVVPAFLVSRIEVPAHCGLLAATPRKRRWDRDTVVELTEVRAAPTIRGARKLTNRQLRRVLDSLAGRFWDLWLGWWNEGAKRNQVGG